MQAIKTNLFVNRKTAPLMVLLLGLLFPGSIIAKAGASGIFTPDVANAAPLAEPCTAPIETISCAVSKSVSLTGSGFGWSPNTCGFTTQGEEKVFSFTPMISGIHTLQVTAANGNYVDYFYKDAAGGCSSGGWNCIDDISVPGSATFGPLTAGITYLILLDAESISNTAHTFQINCPVVPPDPCAAPIETIACASPKSVTLIGSGVGWSPNSCGFITQGAEKVFSFTPTVTGNHTLQVTATNGTYIDYFYKYAAGGCSAGGWTCIDDVSAASSVTFGPLTAGTTYLILLDDESTTITTHTFQINCPSPPVVLTCPVNQMEAANQTQMAINAAFNTWLSTASASGGCNGVFTNNNVGAPPATGGSTIVTFTYTSTCAPLVSTCQATFSVEAGLYQNMQTGQSYALLQSAIDAAMPGQTIVLLDNVSESNVTVNNSVIIEANGFTLTIPSGTLTIPSGKSLTWKEDTLIIASGASIDNDGTLNNNGTIQYQGGTGDFTNTGVYSGIGIFQGDFLNMGTVSPGN